MKVAVVSQEANFLIEGNDANRNRRLQNINSSNFSLGIFFMAVPEV